MSDDTRQRVGKIPAKSDFEAQAERESVGIVREFVDFLAHNKKWWLLPIVVVLLLVGLLLMLTSSSAAPFIYTLF